MRLRYSLQKILGQGALSLLGVATWCVQKLGLAWALRCLMPLVSHASGSLPVVCLDSRTGLTSMVAGLEVGVGERFPFSLWNGRTTGCYPRSASTWGCHCNSSHRTGQVRVTCKGTCRQEAPGTHHSLLLLYSDQTLILLPLVACMSTQWHWCYPLCLC